MHFKSIYYCQSLAIAKLGYYKNNNARAKNLISGIKNSEYSQS